MLRYKVVSKVHRIPQSDHTCWPRKRKTANLSIITSRYYFSTSFIAVYVYCYTCVLLPCMSVSEEVVVLVVTTAPADTLVKFDDCLSAMWFDRRKVVACYLTYCLRDILEVERDRICERVVREE